MFRWALAIILAVGPLTSLCAAGTAARGVVRIMVTSQEPDYLRPWVGGRVSGASGSGFLIDGQRILTNAHVVSNARFLTVTKEGDPTIHPARILYVGHDCDLALITVEDPRFFKNTVPLSLGGIPALESTVSVYGYPIGGDRLSVTRGVVSRVDFQPYSHSGVDSHLAIQIDAAINPGNSGGPVLQDGKVVGVAFQGYSGDVAQNVGYMIPTPVIRRFLKDVADGAYDRYMDIAVSYHPLHNAALRSSLGVPEGRGVFVGAVYPGGSADGLLYPGDVIVSIDGLPVSGDGTVPMDGEQLEMAEAVERKFKGDAVHFEVIRGGKPVSVTVPLNHPWPFSMQANAYDVRPRYLIFGGLVFQSVDANFMRAHNPEDLRLRYHFNQFLSQSIHREKPEIVVLSSILADPVNAGAGEFRYGIVEKVNGQAVKSLEDLAHAVDQDTPFTVIEFAGPSRPLVLERKLVSEAGPRILGRYGIVKERNLAP